MLPGAAPVAMPNDDPGLIGLWTTDLPGSGAYDFYVVALPAAGYPIVAVYPGGGGRADPLQPAGRGGLAGGDRAPARMAPWRSR